MSNQWVSPREDDTWGVHGEGSQRDTKDFDNKQDAIEYAKQIAKNQKSEMIIQKQNGQIQEKNSYGNDPKSSKG